MPIQEPPLIDVLTPEVAGTRGLPVFKGPYDGTTNYLQGDQVSYQGSSWSARIATKGNPPPTLPATINSWWFVVATGADPSQFAEVATTGDYTDLINRPLFGSAASQDATAFATAAQGAKADTALQPGAGISWGDVSGKPTFATVATSGAYSDLSGLPPLGTASAQNVGYFATASQGLLASTALQPAAIGSTVQAYSAALAGTTASFTTALLSKLNGIATGATANQTDAYLLSRANHTGTQAATTITGLATVATSGAYADLTGKPALFSGAYADLTGKPTLFSGAYADLTGKPTLGALAAKDQIAVADINATGTPSATTYLRGDGSWGTPSGGGGGGAGDVVGPSVAVDSRFAAFDGTTGKIIKDSGYSVSDFAPASHVGAGGSVHAAVTTSVAGFMSAADKTKLDGIANGATANQTDAYLLSRANHTGTQAQSTVTSLTTDLAARLLLSGGTMTGALTLFSDPSNALHAATKQYVDGLIAGVGSPRVRVATTATITPSTGLTPGNVIDGVTLAAGDLVLLKDQLAQAQNGVYVCSASPSRAQNFDQWSEIPGALVSVAEGATNADTLWLCTSDFGGTINVTPIIFGKVPISGQLLAANNLSDLPSAGTARTNLGLGSLAILSTISNANWSGTDLSVPNGGTGVSTLTDGGVMVGNGTGAVQVTAVGTAGQVLTSNGPGTDPTFQGVPAGGSLMLIQSQDIVSAVAAVDFTSGITSTYDEYEIHFQNVLPSTNAQDLYFRTSTNGGTSYDAGSTDYVTGGVSFTSASSTVSSLASTGQAQIPLGVATDNTAGYAGVSGKIRLTRPSAAIRQIMAIETEAMNASAAITRRIMVATRNVAADIDAVRFLFASGNIASGYLKLYGVKKT